MSPPTSLEHIGTEQKLTEFPPTFLERIGTEQKLTNSQLQVFVPIFSGSSREQIAQQIGINQTALQKRLGEIYTKFGLANEKGPVKFDRLMSRLQHQYIEEIRPKRVFLGWSGEYGLWLAKDLVGTIFKHPKFEVWLSPTDIASEEAWSDDRMFARDYDFGVICLPLSGSSRTSFYTGLLYGYLKKEVYILSLDRASGVYIVPVFDVTQSEELIILMTKMLNDEKAATEWINTKFNEWKKSLEFIRSRLNENHSNALNDINQEFRNIETELEYLKQNRYFIENSCLRAFVNEPMLYLKDQLSHANSVNSAIYIEPILYRSYLNCLQKRSQIIVQAIDLFDESEQFWRSRDGQYILDSTQEQSKRVFMFTSDQQLSRNMETIIRHALKYDVYILKYNDFLDLYNKRKEKLEMTEKASAFAIFSLHEDSVVVSAGHLASNEHNSQIKIDANESGIEKYQRWMDEILKLKSLRKIEGSSKDMKDMFEIIESQIEGARSGFT
jgi:hypothetical protein